MPYCQNLIQSLANWEKALKEFQEVKNQYLEKFSEKEREILNEKRAKLQEAKEEYFKLKKESYVEIEMKNTLLEIITGKKGRKEKLFGPEYEALERLYQGCGLRLLEKGEIEIENGRLSDLYLSSLASEADTPQIIKQRTQAFKEIKRFLKLNGLSCSNNNLLEVDVSKNTELMDLFCENNQLSEINVSENTELLGLDCSHNNLSKIDVKNNKKLIWLDFSSNQLLELDVSENTELDDLNCSDNLLTELDVSYNTKLKSLSCKNNFLNQENCQKIEKMGIKNLSLYPQYPKEILDFLKNLQQREPGLSKEEAREKIKNYLQSPEIQSKLVPGRIGLPDEENLERILTYFFKK